MTNWNNELEDNMRNDFDYELTKQLYKQLWTSTRVPLREQLFNRLRHSIANNQFKLTRNIKEALR